MRMIHATPVRNVRSILARGLLAGKSKGKMKSVWVATPGLVIWAYGHAIKRHGATLYTVAIIEVNVPRKWLRRVGKSRKGLWHTGGKDIPITRIVCVRVNKEVTRRGLT